ncbi:Hypothetical protein Cp1002B_0008 [Corynebacterium pseudotuberculosis]|nr:Hypothetical protein CpPAT10_0008 [Corynebacterium pseudotuberculosis PAT10]AEP69286.1 Hypothetical protein Cp4202_0007 [Corynebacterium pseudotuberculosis 42/02-A]AER68137.1 Hypothetical protein Cp106_0007 [Corynebacterium pseudotuberculosis 1/06-A]AFF21174.1 Hypothetical protein CpP54B96_0008 [Corynebacterium pseudotuberculosis P54B96]AFH50917.1 Hypothetical protein Cp267_0008 [Corynebacterium pseudotuberculosis 267]AKJ54672.1 Hypothetical protein Cp12C_0008 [Corynebacterium pseudotubercu
MFLRHFIAAKELNHVTSVTVVITVNGSE